MVLDLRSFKSTCLSVLLVGLNLESTAVPPQSYFKRNVSSFFQLALLSLPPSLCLSKLGVKNVGGLRLDCPHTFEKCNLYVVTAVTLPGKEGKKTALIFQEHGVFKNSCFSHPTGQRARAY